MNRTLYRTVWRSQEIEFKDMNWDALISDTLNYLCSLNDQRFIEVDREFILKSEAEKYVKEHPVHITRLKDCFFVRWLELHEIVFNEDDCEAGFNLLDFDDLVVVSKLDLMNVPVESISSFDLHSVPIEVIEELLKS